MLAACRNDAITYLHLINPDAPCQAVETHYMSKVQDTALCVSNGKVWFCRAGDDQNPPTCTDVGTVHLERQ